MTRILVAGATGLVGRHVLASALADARVTRVVAPTRRPLAEHAKLLNPVIDFDVLSGDAEWWAVDGAISALGTTRATAGSVSAFKAIDRDLPLAIAKRVRGAGAVRFALTSSMGADARSALLYLRTKGELEHALTKLGFCSLTIVRPGVLGGKRAEFRVGERVASIVLGAAEPLLPRRLRISPAERVAEVLVEAAVAGVPGRHVVEADRLAVPA